ncbi:MAG TPA: N-acetyltransferase [Actinomycetales bacterium]|nr:N-acetyltransferase [Actinomycetales bacterium]
MTSAPDPTDPHAPAPPLPPGWTSHAAASADVHALHALLVQHEQEARGGSGASIGDVEADVVGSGAASRRHQVLRDADGQVRGWATAWDRAAGRVIVAVVVDREVDSDSADAAGVALYSQAATDAAHLARERGLAVTQLDAGAFEGDERQHRWLRAAGYSHVRTWWQMSRPVVPAEGEPGAFPPPKEGVVVRQVEQETEGGRPSDADLRAVHDVMEEAFTDHFNYHEEAFDEFVERQREAHGHRWDHWWLAELVDGPAEPAGALVGEFVPGGTGKPNGSYVSYIGVLRNARGRGVGRSLLQAIIADAASRGRDHVGLEVDATSPTGAEHLYTSMGFVTKYTTESWHRDLPVT